MSSSMSGLPGFGRSLGWNDRYAPVSVSYFVLHNLDRDAACSCLKGSDVKNLKSFHNIIDKFKFSDIIIEHSFANQQSRGCTGFDGGFEIMVAIRDPGITLITGHLKLNANDSLAFAA